MKYRKPSWKPAFTLLAILSLALISSHVLAQAVDPAAPPAGALAAGPPAPEDDNSFLGLMLKGGWMMIPIGLCSLAGGALIIERCFALRRKGIAPTGFLEGLKGVFHGVEDRDAALQYCRSRHLPIARICAMGIRKMPQGVEAVEQSIEDAGANEVAKLRRNLKLIFGIASIAPMLGLLGTVWGMIEAFQAAAEQGLGGGGTGAKGLAKGIYEALVTTFAGLSVAIPILVFYYYFQGKIEKVVTDLNDVSEEFIENYLPQLTPVATAKPASKPREMPSMPIPAGQPVA
ncbi:MAG: MotA/TolQ/ExbB proton channel family protein [Phycisphaeraceae bacterium]